MTLQIEGYPQPIPLTLNKPVSKRVACMVLALLANRDAIETLPSGEVHLRFGNSQIEVFLEKKMGKFNVAILDSIEQMRLD